MSSQSPPNSTTSIVVDSQPVAKKSRTESSAVAPLATVSLARRNCNLTFVYGGGARAAVDATKSATQQGDESCVVIVGRVAGAEASFRRLAVAASLEGVGQPPAKKLIAAVGFASGGVIDESFFIISDERDGEAVIVGTVNSVHIIVVVFDETPADDAHVLAALEEIAGAGEMSNYLRKFFDEGYERTESDGPKEDDGEPPKLVLGSLPCAAMFTSTEDGKGLVRVTQKTKVVSGTIHSMALLLPAHSPEHALREAGRCVLRRAPSISGGGYNSTLADALSLTKVADLAKRASAAPSAGGAPLPAASFTVLYCGASWCPPCMRIIKELPSMVSGLGAAHLPIEHAAQPFANAIVLPEGPMTKEVEANVSLHTVTAMLKADYDTSPSILKMFGVKTIPTFIVLDNHKLVGVDAVSAEVTLGGALVGEPLQNSQRPIVSEYFAKLCAAAPVFSLDEDF